MSEVLFETRDVYSRVLSAEEIGLVQNFFDANPEYFLTVNGQPAAPDQAHADFNDVPPAHLGFASRWFAGVFDRSHELVGVVEVLSDFVVPGVWHIGLLMLASRLHGRGIAAPLYASLEDWMRREGTVWLRLGVVVGNAKGERFWFKHGFFEVRVRAGIDTGGRVNSLRVLVKPMSDRDLASYLALMPRDRPGSSLP